MSEPEAITFEVELDPRGKMHPVGARGVRGRLARWGTRKAPGNKALVTVRRFVKLKSNNQLAYFHGPVLEYWCEYTGYEKDEMKWELKDAFLPKVPKVNPLTGEETMVTPSLRKVSSEVMSEFISRCVKEGNLKGISFPNPDEVPEGL